jgi:hypothetical protein
MAVYNPITPEALKASILIEIRNNHTSIAADALIKKGIVPREYIDKLLLIDNMNQLKSASQSEITDVQRIAKLEALLKRHCSASTASFISNLY